LEILNRKIVFGMPEFSLCQRTHNTGDGNKRCVRQEAKSKTKEVKMVFGSGAQALI